MQLKSRHNYPVTLSQTQKYLPVLADIKFKNIASSFLRALLVAPMECHPPPAVL